MNVAYNKIDKPIRNLVRKFNDFGLETIASCCGFVHQPGASGGFCKDTFIKFRVPTKNLFSAMWGLSQLQAFPYYQVTNHPKFDMLKIASVRPTFRIGTWTGDHLHIVWEYRPAFIGEFNEDTDRELKIEMIKDMEGLIDVFVRIFPTLYR
jgi:hypothetical protein